MNRREAKAVAKARMWLSQRGIDNLRAVRAGEAGEATMSPAEIDACRISLDNILALDKGEPDADLLSPGPVRAASAGKD